MTLRWRITNDDVHGDVSDVAVFAMRVCRGGRLRYVHERWALDALDSRFRDATLCVYER
jgi:hypothetical protein